jgi:hypothetical protein
MRSCPIFWSRVAEGVAEGAGEGGTAVAVEAGEVGVGEEAASCLQAARKAVSAGGTAARKRRRERLRGVIRASK